MAKDHNGISFPEAGDTYPLLPYIVRSQDQEGVLLGFVEALRKSHNAAKERVRLAWIAQNPYHTGNVIPENFSESEDEFNKWVEDNSIEPSSSIRDSIHMLQQTGKLLRLLGSGLGGLYDSPDITILRQIVATTITRHQKRGTNWLINRIGGILGIGSIHVTELWQRSSLSRPDEINHSENDEDLSPDPAVFPRLTGREQFPTSEEEYSSMWDLSDGGVKSVSLQFSVDRNRNSYLKFQINKNTPLIRMIGEVDSPLQPGTYHLSGGTDSSPAFVSIPLLMEARSIVLESSYAGIQGNDISVKIGVWDGNSAEFTLTGPISRIKYKSSIYDCNVFVDPTIASHALEFDVDDTTAVSMPSLNTAASSIYSEELVPMTRHKRRNTVGIGFTDQVSYSPAVPLYKLILPDEAGEFYRVLPLPPTSSTNLEYYLVDATVEEIAEFNDLPVQWDDELGEMLEYSLNGYGIDAAISLSSTERLDSSIIYLSPWFIQSVGGVVQVRHAQSNEHWEGEVTPYQASLSTEFERFSTDTLKHLTDKAKLWARIPIDTTYSISSGVFSILIPAKLQYPALFLVDITGVGSEVISIAAGTEGNTSFAPTSLPDLVEGDESSITLISDQPNLWLSNVPTNKVDTLYDLAMHDNAGYYLLEGGGSRWKYRLDGKESGYDIRYRSAGVVGSYILSNPLINDDDNPHNPILQIIDNHGKVIWRDDVTNVAMERKFFMDGSFTDTPLSHMDGPIEGGGTYPSTGDRVTPNTQDLLSYPPQNQQYTAISSSNIDSTSVQSVIDASGSMEFVIESALLAIPGEVYVEIDSGGDSGIFTINTNESTLSSLVSFETYTPSTASLLLPKAVEIATITPQEVEFRLEFSGSTKLKYVVVEEAPNGDVSILDQEVNGDTFSDTLIKVTSQDTGSRVVLFMWVDNETHVFAKGSAEEFPIDLGGERAISAARDHFAVELISHTP